MKNLHRNYVYKAKVLWLTGLSGSGKSTIAKSIKKKLEKLEIKVHLIDGDDLRKNVSADLTYTKDDRSRNIKRATDIANSYFKNDLMVIVTLTSPSRKDRNIAKQVIGPENFIEIYISTPLNICKERDPKKLYEKMDKGLISNMVGIDLIYEAPLTPNITIDTSKENFKTSVNRIISYLYREVPKI